VVAVVAVIEGLGTAETEWGEWLAGASWPSVAPGGFEFPVVVAPHPDDEILGVGGLLASTGRAEIVAVTDGEASHPHTTVVTPDDLIRLRPEESRQALDRLGVDARTHRLRQPDGGIDEAALTDALVWLLAPGRQCLATWRGDGHPDHEAVGRAAATACARNGAVLWEYPIWMWHWTRPDDPRVPWDRAHRVPLDPAVVPVKAHAIDAFATQIADIDGVTILPPHVLARFARPFEVLFR
jgi:LmbE family N-acetylglucosaminyl deacetylase